MARNANDTKRRIHEAALSEFSEHGLHGTTMERIAARAGVNKERVYHYFGDKAAMFGVVVREEAEKIARAVPLESMPMDDFGEIAGRTFDYQRDHPELARLIIWEGLTNSDEIRGDRGRGELYRSKVEEVAAAQREGSIDDAVDPDLLVFMLHALAGWWDAAPQVARMLTGKDLDAAEERERRRAAVVEAARRIALPKDRSP